MKRAVNHYERTGASERDPSLCSGLRAGDALEGHTPLVGWFVEFYSCQERALVLAETKARQLGRSFAKSFARPPESETLYLA